MTLEATRAPASAELRQRFDSALAAFIDRQDPSWPDGAPRGALDSLRRFILAGGKRIRPTFCYWGWRGGGGNDCAEVVNAAAALELFHAFALIHDDIMDGSEQRRGQPSVHRHFADVHAGNGWRGDAARYGRSAALLAGDLCAAWADHMYAESGLPVESQQSAGYERRHSRRPGRPAAWAAYRGGAWSPPGRHRGCAEPE